ncbi:MAG: nitrogen-specific signal transduction histidine kinase/CheY-like chemotaxis protein, partial [Gammaproteobacteria bacterium]
AQVQARAVRVRLEDQLRHAQKRETVGRLVGGLAHELNNVLGGVLGYLDLAIGLGDSASEPKLGEYLGESKKAAERAEALVVKLGQYSGHTEAELKPVFPDVLVRESFPQLSSALPSAVTIRLEINDGLPPVSANTEQFHRVLDHLCRNASDAQSHTGEIVIRVDAPVESRFRCASCSLHVRGAYVAFGVSDHGSGISPQILARMFEPFFSGNNADDASGMGLAVAHGIVHDQQGHFLVESQLGQGASVQVLLPVAQSPFGPPGRTKHLGDGLGGSRNQPTQAGPAAVPGPSVLAGKRVLVIDDELCFGEFVQELLVTYGCRAEVQTDVRGAIRRFREASDQFDAVVVDYAMPGLTGIELSEVLLKSRPNIPIILCTGMVEQVDKERIEYLGIRAVLRKPVTLPALLSHLWRCWS